MFNWFTRLFGKKGEKRPFVALSSPPSPPIVPEERTKNQAVLAEIFGQINLDGIRSWLDRTCTAVADRIDGFVERPIYMENTPADILSFGTQGVFYRLFRQKKERGPGRKEFVLKDKKEAAEISHQLRSHGDVTYLLGVELSIDVGADEMEQAKRILGTILRAEPELSQFEDGTTSFTDGGRRLSQLIYPIGYEDLDRVAVACAKDIDSGSEVTPVDGNLLRLFKLAAFDLPGAASTKEIMNLAWNSGAEVQSSPVVGQAGEVARRLLERGGPDSTDGKGRRGRS